MTVAVNQPNDSFVLKTDKARIGGGQLDQSPASIAATYLRRLVSRRPLRIGARTSPMAVAQAERVAGLLASLVPGLDVTISGITTTADQWAGDLAALGGKGRSPRRSTAPCSWARSTPPFTA